MAFLLFVDDDTEILNSIRRLLYPMRKTWICQYASSGEDALELVKKTHFDVIVSDIRMPNMDGVMFFTLVSDLSPGTIRIALSGQSNYGASLGASSIIHHFLTKPVDNKTFINSIQYALELKSLLTDKSVKAAISKLKSLPSKPDNYNKIMRELAKPEPSINQVAGYIEEDIGTSAKMMHLVNSAFFGLPRHIETPVHAVVLLGLDTVSSLFLSINLFSQFDSRLLEKLNLEQTYDHSLRVGTLSAKLMNYLEPDTFTKDKAFIAGYMHDLGKLVFATNYPEVYRTIILHSKRGQNTLCELERQNIKADHAQAGAYLLGLWKFSEDVIQAIVLHHQDPEMLRFSSNLARVLAFANVWDHIKKESPEKAADEDYLKSRLEMYGLPLELVSLSK